ncbi:transmembrane anchor protein [Terasakiella sp. SH-1]|uniref:transmembrane anchor protein n=1 Tax=Terasakiella sp. SH-1 TaxID=2560057 RepID=UPI0010730CC0|nr:transmembrane anchor protein [Terasakiella sp. SH-1]
MYNENIPSHVELPSTKQLIKSTVISFVSAVVILVTIVLPSEYAIDPTGVGRLLGLTEMGEIKAQLAEEAAQDHGSNITDKSPWNAFASLFAIKSANAETPTSSWTDEISFELVPGQGTEYKLKMKKGAVAHYDWSVEGGRANYDLHGDGSGKSTSYQKGRGVTGDVGGLIAKFDGYHGWFWRNRDKQPIKITLRVKGEYSELKHMK